jgi:small subunit ribosomal protein S4
MGAPRKLRKKYKGPQHPFNAERFEQELKYVGEYGLRNKKELYKIHTRLGKYRSRARSLLALEEDSEKRTQNEGLILTKLNKLGVIKSESFSIDEILNLQAEDFLERRLQTVVFRKGLARTPHQARQLIIHGHIAIKGRRVNVPSYHLLEGEEDLVDYAPNSPYYDPEHPMRLSLIDSVQNEESPEEEM